jgi:uncharacterized membrane protein
VTAPSPPLDDRPADLEVRIPKLLRTGLVASLVLMAAGLAAAAALRSAPAGGFSLFEIPAALAAFDPRGLLGAGILVLVVTPLARVAASLAHFLRERDGLYVGLTALVAVNLVLAVFVGAV